MCAENRIPEADIQDWRNLRQEVLDIIDKEEEKLERFDEELTEALEMFSELPEHQSEAYQFSLETAREDIKAIREELQEVKEQLAREPENMEELNSRFNSIGVLVGPLIRKSSHLRTRLTRHTPPLKGQPSSPDPRQLHTLRELENVTVDYLRSSSLFSVETNDGEEELAWNQKPLLKDNAEEVSEILFDYKPDISLAFNGAIGAIKTARSLIEADCRDGRQIALHEKSWLEIKFDVEDSGTGLYSFNECETAEELMSILEREDIGGLIVEPVMNHPKMSKIDIIGLLDRLAEKDSFEEPKYLLIDSAHVPSLNLFRHIQDQLPSNLCLLNAVSTVKFLQAGWDLTKGGVLGVKVNEDEFDSDPVETILQTRGNNGTGLSYEEAELMAIETRQSYDSRMERYDRNIEIIQERLQEFIEGNSLGEIGFVEDAKLLYINLDGEIEEKTREIHENLLSRAEKENIPLIDASSFGLNTPHIHFVLHPEEDQLIRLSPGSTNRSTVESLADILKEEIEAKVKETQKS